MNEATEGATGVLRQRLVGSDFSDYFTEPEKANEGYRKVLAEGQVRDYPLTIRRVSGRTTDVLYNAVVYRTRRARGGRLRRRPRRHREQTGRRTTPPIPGAPGGVGGPADDGSGGCRIGS